MASKDWSCMEVDSRSIWVYLYRGFRNCRTPIGGRWRWVSQGELGSGGAMKKKEAEWRGRV